MSMYTVQYGVVVKTGASSEDYIKILASPYADSSLKFIKCFLRLLTNPSICFS